MFNIKTIILLIALILLINCLIAVLNSSTVYSQAPPILFENFETGAPGWTFDPPVDGVQWQIICSPETIYVLSPDIDPNLITVPDSPAHLPEAFSGNCVVWFGHLDTGTYIGDSWTLVTQDPKNGGTSGVPRINGSLTTPSFPPTPKGSHLTFASWWEVESVDPNYYDLMIIEAYVNGTWVEVASLNPTTYPPWGEPDLHYASGYSGLGEPAVSSDPFDPPKWVIYDIELPNGTTQIRFIFDTRDPYYNGFRGWIIDYVKITGPPVVGGVILGSRSNNSQNMALIIISSAIAAFITVYAFKRKNIVK